MEQAGREGTPGSRVASAVAGALKWWEPRRLIYNGLLLAVVVVDVALNWSALSADASVDGFLGLVFMAVLANVAYCAAYPVDLFLQLSGIERARRWGRIAVFVVGCGFAAIRAPARAASQQGGSPCRGRPGSRSRR